MVPLSPSTVAFLGKCVRSQIQIDILLVLYREDGRWWNAGQLGDEIGLAESRVASALEELAACNLLDVRIGSTLTYRFAPVDGAARIAMSEASARPYEARETVAQITRKSRAAERFADAFRIRASDG